ncbi:MAG: putative Ig domain-containing protein [Myxococcota bacterium]
MFTQHKIFIFSFIFSFSLLIFLTSCDFNAVEKECLANTSFCDPDNQRDILLCNSTGTDFTTKSCPESQLCDKGKCVTDENNLLQIVTTELPSGENGHPYQASLEAEGGAKPYGWQIINGQLPQGLTLTADGTILGTTDFPADLNLVFRVTDSTTPPYHADKELKFTIEIAPLEIFGENTYTFMMVKIIILPVLIPYVPYNASLQARGGLKPYLWSEIDPPAGFSDYITSWGFPGSLQLSENGELSGTVEDVSDASSVTMPDGTTINGYFINMQVQDSQEPSSSDTSIYCIPTVPI